MLTRNLFRRPRNKLEDAGANSMARPEIPGQLYASCPNCKAMNPAEELSRHADVCPKCQHHFRVSARRMIALTADENTFQELWPTLRGVNPIAFPDYDKKLVSAREQSNEVEAVVVGECQIGCIPACLFAMEPSFMMGSMGTAVGEKIARLFEYALEKSLPVVGFCVSGGARMQEGILALMQMAKTADAVRQLNEAAIPYITVLTDPTTGGVLASFASLGDIVLAEPGAYIGFAGQRLITGALNVELPPGFQRAEYQYENGFVDQIVKRGDLRPLLARLLKCLAPAAQEPSAPVS